MLCPPFQVLSLQLFPAIPLASCTCQVVAREGLAAPCSAPIMGLAAPCSAPIMGLAAPCSAPIMGLAAPCSAPSTGGSRLHLLWRTALTTEAAFMDTWERGPPRGAAAAPTDGWVQEPKWQMLLPPRDTHPQGSVGSGQSVLPECS